MIQYEYSQVDRKRLVRDHEVLLRSSWFPSKVQHEHFLVKLWKSCYFPFLHNYVFLLLNEQTHQRIQNLLLLLLWWIYQKCSEIVQFQVQFGQQMLSKMFEHKLYLKHFQMHCCLEKKCWKLFICVELERFYCCLMYYFLCFCYFVLSIIQAKTGENNCENEFSWIRHNWMIKTDHNW